MAEAHGEIILFTDADTEPAPDWVERMRAPFGDPAGGVAEARERIARGKAVGARLVQIEYEEKYDRMARRRQVDVVDTYSAAYRRGGLAWRADLTSRFLRPVVEDAEFSYRLVKQGCKLVFIPDAIVFHQHASTLSAYCRRKFKIGYWRVRVHAQHPDKALSDSHTPMTQKIQVVLFPFLLALGLASVWLRELLWLALPLAALYVFTLFPLMWRSLKRDLWLGLAAPLFITCRALAQSAGILVGLLANAHTLWESVSRQPADPRNS